MAHPTAGSDGDRAEATSIDLASARSATSSNRQEVRSMSESAKKKTTVPAIRAMKGARRIGMLTAYDFPSARIVDKAGADIILVGDSLGMVVLGYPDTLRVTMDDMLHHTRAVARGNENSLVV